jgi:hypothetical protein
MKTVLGIFMALMVGSLGAQTINNQPYGSGTPGATGPENATLVDNNVFHAPQYLPGSPTAASIWPRVVEVPCTNVGGAIRCDGYVWQPRLGRGEYLFFKPVVATPVQPQVIQSPPQIIREIREVEVSPKKIRE